MTAAAALQPAQAKAPAAPAPPVVMRQIDGGMLDSGPTASLSNIPLFAPPAPPPISAATPASGGAVQRQCETCDQDETEDYSQVRPRLEVGAADDPFEREADTIAASVMAMRDSDLAPAQTNAALAGSAVQRVCSACNASRDDDVRARRLGEEEDQIGVVRRQSIGSDTLADESEVPRMRTAGAVGGESIAASAGELTSGGSALPSSTRSFFETRMGRDLSRVRLHVGSSAGALSRSIGARAFTFRNHVWLGQGEGTEPSFTLAHELAHVLQQTAPGPVAPNRSITHGPQSGARPDATWAIRRNILEESEPYFMPVGASGNTRDFMSKKHTEAQAALLKPNKGLLTEVPMPGADRDKFEVGERYGYADLYFSGTKASPSKKLPAVIGVQAVNGGTAQNGLANFTNKNEPDAVTGSSGPITVTKGKKVGVINIGGVSNFDRASAPKIDWPRQAIVDSGKMPTNIKLGEVKSAHSIRYRRSGVKQLKNYVSGINAAADATNRLYPGTNWVPNPKRMRGRELKLPKGWDASRSHGTWPVKDIGIRWSQKVEIDETSTKRVTAKTHHRRDAPKKYRIRGRWMIARGSRRKDGGDGILVYYLHPKPADLRASLKKNNFTARFKEKLAAVHQIPARLRKPPKKASRAAAKVTPRLKVTPDRFPRKPRRKALADDFAATKWEAFRRGHKSHTKESSGNVLEQLYTLAPEDVLNRVNEQAAMVNWVRENPDNVPIPTDVKTEASNHKVWSDYKFLKKAAFWTGGTAKPLGILRDKFGGIAVKGINKFEEFKKKVSDKIEARKKKALKRSKSKRGGIMLKAAKGVMAALLPMIVMPLVRQTFALIMDCVENGFRAKFKSLLPEDGPIANLQQMSVDIKDQIETMATDIEASIDAAVNSVVGEYEGKVSKIIEDSKNVLTIVSMIKDLANGLRISACLISLATAPATLGLGAVVGCGFAVADWILSQLGMSPIDYVIAKTIESCPSKNIIGKLMAGFSVVQEMPGTLARISVAKIKAALKAYVPGNMLGRKLGDHATELLCDETAITAKAEPFKPLKCGGDDGAGGVGVPDLPENLVGKTYQPGNPINANERKYMEGRDHAIPKHPTGTPGTSKGEPTSRKRKTWSESGGKMPSDADKATTARQIDSIRNRSNGRYDIVIQVVDDKGRVFGPAEFSNVAIHGEIKTGAKLQFAPTELQKLILETNTHISTLFYKKGTKYTAIFVGQGVSK